MQVASKHNRNPGFKWLKEIVFYFCCRIGACPSDVAGPGTPFHLPCSLLSSLLPYYTSICQSCSSHQATFAKDNRNTEQCFLKIQLLYLYCSHLGHSSSGVSHCPWEKIVLGGWRRDGCSCASVLCRLNKRCLKICSWLSEMTAAPWR